MTTVYEYAEEFMKRAQRGEKPTAHVSRQYAGDFLGVLAREGFALARSALDQIHDPELRRIVETIFFSTAAGSVAGAAVGGAIAGEPGVLVGAAIGTALGFAAACIALTLTLHQDGNDLVVSVG